MADNRPHSHTILLLSLPLSRVICIFGVGVVCISSLIFLTARCRRILHRKYHHIIIIVINRRGDRKTYNCVCVNGQTMSTPFVKQPVNTQRSVLNEIELSFRAIEYVCACIRACV